MKLNNTRRSKREGGRRGKGDRGKRGAAEFQVACLSKSKHWENSIDSARRSLYPRGGGDSKEIGEIEGGKKRSEG